VRDAFGNCIWPKLTRIGDGPYYAFEDEQGGAVHEKTLSLNQLTLADDWYASPYDPEQLRTETAEDGNTLLGISFRVTGETRRAVQMAATADGLDVSAWIRKAVDQKLNAVDHQEGAYPGAKGAVEAVAARLAAIEAIADECSERDLSLYVRTYRFLLSRLLDPAVDMGQTRADLVAFWRKIGVELSKIQADQTLGPAALSMPIMLNSTVQDLKSIGRNLRAVGS
jgi:hypothetical protein